MKAFPLLPVEGEENHQCIGGECVEYGGSIKQETSLDEIGVCKQGNVEVLQYECHLADGIQEICNQDVAEKGNYPFLILPKVLMLV